MIDMFLQSVKAFLRGKLFQDQKRAVLLGLVGVGVTLVVFVVGSRFLPLWLAAIIAGLVGGALQPYLFKNLKFR